MQQFFRRATAVAALLVVAWLGPAPGHAFEQSAGHGRCSSCHLGERSEPSTAVAAGLRCGSCHGDKLGDESSLRAGSVTSASAPAPSGHTDCASCHASHANGQPFQLKADLNGAVPVMLAGTRLDGVSRLCLSCHDEFGQTRGPRGHFVRHPVGLALAGGRRLAAARLGLPLMDAANTADPTDDVLSCITCHDVHAGEGTFRLRWNAESEPAVCRGCHAMEGEPTTLLARTGF